MSIHNIPSDVDYAYLITAISKHIRDSFGFEGGSPTQPASMVFTPDLAQDEIDKLNELIDIASSIGNGATLPTWVKTFTPSSAAQYVHDNVLNGFEQADVDAYIAGLPNTVAGLKTGLTQIGYALVDIRNLLEFIVKLLIYIRDLIIKYRQ